MEGPAAAVGTSAEGGETKPLTRDVEVVPNLSTAAQAQTSDNTATALLTDALCGLVSKPDLYLIKAAQSSTYVLILC